MLLPFESVVSIHGVPRSGTSWLGQILNSHPSTAYRHQPLFAYRFKDRISPDSTEEEIYLFLNQLYEVTDDDFILDRRDAYEDHHLDFRKVNSPPVLVMKMVRYHHLIKKLLDSVSEMKVIGLVRNPCAVTNSWLRAPKEFEAEWDPMQEWRLARKKNRGRVEEFNGFEKWKEVARMFLELTTEYPQRFCLVRYQDLVSNPVAEAELLLRFAGLDLCPQVVRFVKRSRSQHCDHPYSVFKSPAVKDRWKEELDPVIRREIIEEVAGTELERFLV